jgi:hypothetical protein
MIMEVALNKNIVVFNQGFIETIKSLSNPYIRYDNNDAKYITSYGREDTFYIKTTKSNTEFSVNINNMTISSIKVTNGYIGAKAVALKQSKLFTKFGAIEFRIKKEEVGHLYLKVDSGMIIDNSKLIEINQMGLTGFEGFFKGELEDQKTEIFVKAGAIVCTIY